MCPLVTIVAKTKRRRLDGETVRPLVDRFGNMVGGVVITLDGA